MELYEETDDTETTKIHRGAEESDQRCLQQVTWNSVQACGEELMLLLSSFYSVYCILFEII